MLTAIDIFCGAGGLSEGFIQAGFDILAGNDIDEPAGRTFAATHPSATFVLGPIQNITATQMLDVSGLKSGELDCLIGGPPCQGFSVYNHNRGMHDERSTLFKEYLRLVEGLRPKWIVMENVTGMLSISGGSPVKDIYSGLKNLGYQVDAKVLKAEEYGVPQERRRVFFIGNRVGLPIVWPVAEYGPSRKPFTTVWDAISDLPPLKNGQSSASELAHTCEPKSEYQKMIRAETKYVLNHAAPKLSDINVERMNYIPEGGSWRDIPVHLLPQGMKKAKRSDHTKRYGRLSKKGLSSTILTKCDVHWGAYIHPIQNRSLTVREAARLQSFPDKFKFEGSRTEQYAQVGNAVPPLLGRKVAEAIISVMNIKHTSSIKTNCIDNKEKQRAVVG
jgi:DNA (cytosine-5)-methyltransferase 1